MLWDLTLGMSRRTDASGITAEGMEHLRELITEHEGSPAEQNNFCNIGRLAEVRFHSRRTEQCSLGW